MKMDDGRARTISQTINSYLTPYAIFLVVLAALAAGINLVTGVSIAIVLCTGIGNVVFVNLLKNNPSKAAVIRNARIGFNYFFNICIVCLLWNTWPPVWMLLLLSICTVGIFEDRRATMLTAGMFTTVLLAIQGARGDFTRFQISELLMRIVSIWTAGLLINRLTHDIEPGSGADTAAD